MFRLWQEAAIANTTISTYEAATKALMVLPPPVGMALAGVITALSMANVAKIASTNYQHKNPANNHALRVGSGNGRHYWKGDLDDIRIYNRALPAKEVENLYDFEKVGK